MCGIAGVINFNTRVSVEVLRKMTDSLSHRGPDGDGHWINQNGSVGFGHRRLAIIDLSDDGKQPMHYLDGRYTITFNGEIYNYIEIKENLTKKGYKFQSRSDTEVLLALYHDKKEECLQDLDGMFAFAIWDEKEQRLFCARDRFGEKPFYYTFHDGSFYFASEMKALWAAGVCRETNKQMLYNYLEHGYVYNPHDLSQTFYSNIFKLKAAHFFYLTTGEFGCEQKRYWQIDYSSTIENISEEEATEKFREMFFQSVRLRLRSDVPVGSSLSGGLDSSLIVCVIDKLNDEKNISQATFSARFPNFAKDEGKYMEMVINRTKADPHFVYPSDEGLLQDLDDLFYYQEEPFGTASIYAQYCVMRLAKENNVTVLLDGQGADEILAGYHVYFLDYFKELKSKNPDLLKSEEAFYRQIHFGQNGSLDSRHFESSRSMPKKIVSAILPKSVKNKVQDIRRARQQINSPLFSKEFKREFGKDSYLSRTVSPQTLQEALYQSTSQGGLEELLRFADRNSMAHSREVRLPFLNHQMVEFLFSLPSNFKIREGTTKFIMRKAFTDILPKEIIERQDKIGYEPPQNKWMQSKQMTEILDRAQAKLINRKILHPSFPEWSNKSPDRNNSNIIWRVLTSNWLC